MTMMYPVKADDGKLGEAKEHRWKLADIVVDFEVQPRRTKPINYDHTKANIKKDGQIEPVLCRRVKGDNRPHLVFGFTRYQILQELEIEEEKERGIKIKFLNANINESAGYAMAMAENMARSDFSPIDLANGVNRMRNVYEMTREAVAAELFRSVEWVEQMERVYALPPDLQKALETNEIKVDIAFMLESDKSLKTATHRRDVIDRAKALKPAPATVPSTTSEGSKKRATVTKKDIKRVHNADGKATTPTMGELKKAIAGEHPKNKFVQIISLRDYIAGIITKEKFQKTFLEAEVESKKKKE